MPQSLRRAVKGGHSLSQKRVSPFKSPERKVYIASEQLEELQCLPIALPIARRCRVSTARRFASAPTTRCRSAHLVEVEPNFRLPDHSTMRRAPAMPHSAGSLPPDKRHSRLTTVRRGCCQITTRRDSWRSHVHRTHTAQRVQSFKLQTHNVRGRGGRPLVLSLGGCKGGCSLSEEREHPPLSHPHTVWGTPRTPTVRQYEPPPCTSDTPTQGSRNTAPSRRRSCRRPRSRRPGRLPFRPR